jgi:hypothetical protein
VKRIIEAIVYLFSNDISIWRTIYFNFHYFSFRVAVKFPLILYRSVRFKKTKGRIILDTPVIKTGMIHIGKGSYGFQWKHDYTVV